MATVTKTKTKTSTRKGFDIKGALTRKLGPLPAWAWLAIGGVVLFVFRRRGSSTGSGVITQDATPGGDTSTGGGGLGTSGGGGGDSGGGGGDQPPPPVPGPAGTVSDTNNGSGFGSSPTSNPAASPAAQSKRAADLKVATARVSASNADFAAAEQRKTAAAKAAGVPVAFGGVTSVQHLKNGATLTTFASGRQVEQQKGKSAYVTRKAAPKRGARPATRKRRRK